MNRIDHSWIDAYLSLFGHAGALRGFAECPDIDHQSWPHTTGADVILIAALVDPYVRACGGVPSARRWRAAIAPTTRVAMFAPEATYPDNHGFWQLLATACIDMHVGDVQLPPTAMWLGLLDELRHGAHRNADPMSGTVPFLPRETALVLAKQSPGDVYRAQLAAVMNQRGFDLMDAPPEHAFGGNGMKVPRATNADAIAMVDFWSAWFALVPKDIQGVDVVAKKWAGIVADVDHLARTGKPDEPYEKNNELWRELPNVTGKVVEWANQPDKREMITQSLLESLRRLPETLRDVGKALAGETEKAAGALARGAGKVVNEGAKGALSGVGLPLAIGAGAIGLFLLLRSRKGDDGSSESVT